MSKVARKPLPSMHAGSLSPARIDPPVEQFKILFADDSAMHRRLIEGTLTQSGYIVLSAKDGRAAADLLTEHQPAVVITDWDMPDVTGIDLCKQIRRNHDSYTYVILLTSHSDKDQLIEGLAAGADDYLTKPFHPGELLARVAVGRRIAELHRQILAKNLLLEQLALTDSLTGLPNRRAIEGWAERELAGAARHGFPLWIVMADLDHFKTVNDSYGHEAGDMVLKRFAEVLRENTRASNMCGRTGGEEFVVVLSHANKVGAQTVTERIRRQVEAERITLGGKVIGVTASFGIAGFEEGDTPSVDQLLRDADEALYSAKRGGRNRLEFASGASPRRALNSGR